MNRSLWTLFLLVALLMVVIAPFSALAMLMLFMVASVFVWASWTLIQSFFSNDAT
ncbi:MAG: hypothetical protein RBJ76_15200 [Stenomitos frigidus ULC029]